MRADSPVPAARCQAHALAGADVRTAAMRPDVGGRRCPHRDQRHAGEPGAVGVGDGLDDPRLVGDEHLGHGEAVGPSAHRRAQPRPVDAGPGEPAAGERHRSLAPPAAAGVDEPAGHERWARRVVVDGGDQPVVLIAEVGAEPAAGPERARRRERRQRRDAERVGDDPAPRSVPVPVHRGGAGLEGERAHEHLGVEEPPWRPPRPDQLGAAVDVGPHTGRVAGGEDRLRQHQPHPPATGPRQAHGEGEELGRGVGVRAAAVAARPAPASCWPRAGRGTEGCRARRRSARRPSRGGARRPAGIGRRARPGRPRPCGVRRGPRRGRCRPRSRSEPRRPRRSAPRRRSGSDRRRTPGRAPSPARPVSPRATCWRPRNSTSSGGVANAPRCFRAAWTAGCSGATGRA